ncbi:hypothetical protein GCM10010136_11590 [Limoniibacter endophyticus]|uniref:Acetoacetate decarboxylase n=2 Tax=Limoniibacter endophyticus TaxID=1565040 RepID=A0A8J3DGE8_9HYPH|nr:hypothetical protein GCM10010136_11590 [Limoniibacter endophyticus]
MHFLPPGLEPLEDGAGWVMIAEMAKVSADNPDRFFSDPARCTYNECVLGFYCRFGDRIGRYSALVWVDRDWSLAMGAIFGWGKRLAQVDRTRLQLANPVFADQPVRLGGTVTRYGQPVIRLSVTLDQDALPLEALPGHGGSTFTYRYLASPGPDIAEVEQLLELPFTNVSMRNIRPGHGEIELFDGIDEELGQLGALTVTGAFIYERGWTTDRTARLLHDYTKDGSP